MIYYSSFAILLPFINIKTIHRSTICNSQKVERAQISSMDERINKMWSTNVMEYHPAMTRNDVLILTTGWTNLDNVMLSEETGNKKNHNCMIQLI